MSKQRRMEWEDFLVVIDDGGQDIRKTAMIAIAGFTGFRVGDWTKLKWKDVMDIESGVIHDKINKVSESKTGKKRTVPISATLKKVLLKYYDTVKPVRAEAYLFRPVRGGDIHASITPAGARLVTATATHVFRRTFAYHLFKELGGTFEALCHVSVCLNHSNPNTTITYLGLTEETIHEKIANF